VSRILKEKGKEGKKRWEEWTGPSSRRHLIQFRASLEIDGRRAVTVSVAVAIPSSQ